MKVPMHVCLGHGQQLQCVIAFTSHKTMLCHCFTLQAAAELFNWNVLQLRLWNPLSGSVVSVKDPSGELREVGCLRAKMGV